MTHNQQGCICCFEKKSKNYSALINLNVEVQLKTLLISQDLCQFVPI